jgi:hypothetical protein
MKHTTVPGMLEPDRIIDALTVLGARIRNRFPEAGLNAACERLLAISRRAKRRAETIARPIRGLRVAVALLVLVLLAAPLFVTASFDTPRKALDLFSLVELIDSLARNLTLIAIAVIFLVTLETRIKRIRVLKAIRELRNVAHIIDMHQLSKDPDHATHGLPSADRLSGYAMSRYLEYCNELLALTGKIAAVYIQEFDDSGAVQAVNEIEQLTAGLSQQILQKILILHHDESFGDTGSHLRVEAA